MKFTNMLFPWMICLPISRKYTIKSITFSLFLLLFLWFIEPNICIIRIFIYVRWILLQCYIYFRPYSVFFSWIVKMLLFSRDDHAYADCGCVYMCIVLKNVWNFAFLFYLIHQSHVLSLIYSFIFFSNCFSWVIKCRLQNEEECFYFDLIECSIFFVSIWNCSQILVWNQLKLLYFFLNYSYFHLV